MITIMIIVMSSSSSSSSSSSRSSSSSSSIVISCISVAMVSSVDNIIMTMMVIIIIIIIIIISISMIVVMINSSNDNSNTHNNNNNNNDDNNNNSKAVHGQQRDDVRVAHDVDGQLGRPRVVPRGRQQLVPEHGEVVAVFQRHELTVLLLVALAAEVVEVPREPQRLVLVHAREERLGVHIGEAPGVHEGVRHVAEAGAGVHHGAVDHAGQELAPLFLVLSAPA